uniref:NADH-ubiquinone oxidoreductase chain 3 n=1 Tax=Notocotylus intestinalis TaxID=1197314 RepID=A0A8A4JEH1_9TREM|nr:NADH dehydrogenase subunit 3 [Notocotylus intestinalis]QTC30702.1 NADH dehydrogenase subunit 3 [Notocotylus intestinalis]
MFIVLSSLVIFFLVFFLILVFHLFVWNMDWFFTSGSRSWISSYECGFLSQRVVENYFSYTYFILLVFFVVFDLEISLLLNLPLQGVLYNNLNYYVLFLVLLCVGFGVEINKGYVTWSY